MKLTQKEKDILTLLDDVMVDEFLEYYKRFVNYSEKEVKRMVKKLVDIGLVRIVSIPQGKKEKEWYYHTGEVEPEMLNDNIRYKKDYGN